MKADAADGPGSVLPSAFQIPRDARRRVADKRTRRKRYPLVSSSFNISSSLVWILNPDSSNHYRNAGSMWWEPAIPGFMANRWPAAHGGLICYNYNWPITGRLRGRPILHSIPLVFIWHSWELHDLRPKFTLPQVANIHISTNKSALLITMDKPMHPQPVAG